MQLPFKRKSSLLMLSIQLGLGASIISAPVLATNSGIQSQAQTYSIPSGQLDEVLNQFALQSGIEFYLDSSLSAGLYSQGLQGDYTPEQALVLLLDSTGLTAEPQSDGVYLLIPDTANTMTLDTISVTSALGDGHSRDADGAMAVYDADVSSEYMGKDQVERFKGSTAADLFTGMANVGSGEARNSGAIDPNIRGIQGSGRVPVVIDGTEQAITVYSGYRGAANRSYLDPNLIGGMQVLKGAQITMDANTSVGGAVVVSTLTPEDIVAKGETFGSEIILESSSNAVEPYKAGQHAGKRWQDVPAYHNASGIELYNDPELRFQTRDDKDNNPFSGDDVAFRVAAAGIESKFDWLAAYAYRKRGNYYSGTHKSGFYKQGQGANSEGVAGRVPFLQPHYMALNHLPGQEVFNTSSEMESILLKSTFKFDDFNKLQLTARYSENINGEILPSRSDYRNVNGMAQWPLAEIRLQSYSAKFRSNPDTDWIDLTSNLWMTISDSKTNTAGGFPNYVHLNSENPDIIIDGSTSHYDEERVGFDIKNKMLLTDNLDLSISGRYQHHTLKPSQGLDYMIDYYEGGAVRSGERREFDGALQMEWRATDSLIFNAGMRYNQYDVVDHYIKNRVKAGELSRLQDYQTNHWNVFYQTVEHYEPEELAQNVANAEIDVRENFTQDILTDQITRLENMILFFPDKAEEFREQIESYQAQLNNFDQELANKVNAAVTQAQNETTYLLDHHSVWNYDASHDLSPDGNACISAINQSNYVAGSCRLTQVADDTLTNTKYETSGEGWVPSLGATWLISDSNRVYARYAETLRFPSLFESTMGFSASPMVKTPLEAEHAKLFEIAYVHYFDNASAKLTYFDQRIDDVIDRDISRMSFKNLDSQHTSGVEMQIDYDNEQFFGNLSAAYNFRNEVCDEHSAVYEFILTIKEAESTSFEECRRGGFGKQSYLASHAAPEYTGSMLIGGRFFNQDLETGWRTNYASDSHKENPIQRESILTHDAYISYKLSDAMAAQLVISNLTDIYYLDVNTTSGMPAPGRTVGIKLQGRF